MARKEQGGHQKSASRVEDVAATIGRWIAEGRYPAASTLPTESEIADSLGVGRNAVREAVKMLSGKGLLRTERRAGTIVQPQSEWNMLDSDLLTWSLDNQETREKLVDELMELRRIIEPEVAALAAERASIVEVLRLWEAYEQMETYRMDPVRSIDADVLFHQRLFEAAGSRLLLSVYQSISLLLRVNFALGNHMGGAYINNLEPHKVVSDAVQRHDADAARAAMQGLLSKNRKDVERTRDLTREEGQQA
ncbi:MAG: FadR/GntR family transcriptional regulator [Xanthobacter sp.]